jgi:hypothetical protein
MLGITTRTYTLDTFVSGRISLSVSASNLPFVASAFQSFLLGSGHPTRVPFWSRSFPVPTRLTSYGILNSIGRKAWLSDGPTQGKCLWELHGVWGWDLNKNEGVVLRENYFVKHPTTGKKVSYSRLRLRHNPTRYIFRRSIGTQIFTTRF